MDSVSVGVSPGEASKPFEEADLDIVCVGNGIRAGDEGAGGEGSGRPLRLDEETSRPSDDDDFGRSAPEANAGDADDLAGLVAPTSLVERDDGIASELRVSDRASRASALSLRSSQSATFVDAVALDPSVCLRVRSLGSTGLVTELSAGVVGALCVIEAGRKAGKSAAGATALIGVARGVTSRSSSSGRKSIVLDLAILVGGTHVVAGFACSTGLAGLTFLLGSGVASTMAPRTETEALLASRAPAPPVRLGVPTRSIAGDVGAAKLLRFVVRPISSTVELRLSMEASPASPTDSLRFSREELRLTGVEGRAEALDATELTVEAAVEAAVEASDIDAVEAIVGEPEVDAVEADDAGTSLAPNSAALKISCALGKLGGETLRANGPRPLCAGSGSPCRCAASVSRASTLSSDVLGLTPLTLRTSTLSAVRGGPVELCRAVRI